MNKRVLALVLTLIISVTMILPPFYLKVEAADNVADTNERQSRFVNYWAKSDGAIVEAKDLSVTEYDTLYVFLSNFFKPGVTTLADLTKTDSDLMVEMRQAFGFESNPDTFNNIVKQFVTDFRNNGINEGKCTLYYDDGVADGLDFLLALKSKVHSAVDDANYMSTLYCKDNGNNKTVLDFNSEAVLAAFKILYAYNPHMFLYATGIRSTDMFFVDSVGNVWGAKMPTTEGLSEIHSADARIPETGVTTITQKRAEELRVEWARTSAGGKGLTPTSSNFNTYFPNECIYLILPACLNPIVFSPNVTNPTYSADLRLPLMNSFVLPYLVKKSDFENTCLSIEENMIPFYNILNTNRIDTGLNKRLHIFCVNSLTPYLGNTGSIPGLSEGLVKTNSFNWTFQNRKKDFANLFYNSATALIETKDNKGIGRYGTNSFVVISPRFDIDIFSGEAYANADVDNKVLDIHNSAPWGDNIFDVFGKDGDTSLIRQGELLMALCSPSFLDFNHVCMTTYVLDDNVKQDEDAFEKFSDSLTSNDLAVKMGMKGLDLFFDSNLSGQKLNNEEYTVFSPRSDMQIKSKFIKEFTSEDANSINESPGGWADFYDNAHSSSTEALLINLVGCTEETAKKLREYLNISISYSNLTDIHNQNINNYETEEVENLKRFLNGYNEMFGTDTNTNAMKYTIVTKSGTDGSYHYELNFDSGLKDTVSLENQNTAWGRFHPLISLTDSNIFFQNPYNLTRFTSNASKSKLSRLPISYEVIDSRAYVDLFLTEYGYTLFFPSDKTIKALCNSSNNPVSGTFWGYSSEDSLDKNTFNNIYLPQVNFSSELPVVMGVYFGYLLDIHSIDVLTAQSADGKTPAEFRPGGLNTTFLPVYSISANGQLSYTGELDSELSGVIGSSNTSFEKMQEDLIRRIYGITDDQNNDYRNNLIKNIIEGFLITVHRTITGTWGSNVSSVSTGNSSTYQSVTGYIYTPTLEELSFTSSIMDNYVKIYILCMILIIFIAVLMTLLHMRSWQQSLIVCLTMFIALLFPYILISNSINISNKVSDSIYSDRFDFWALSDHYASLLTLQSAKGMTEKDALLTRLSATSDSTRSGDPGVKIKWMSPKKVELFQNLYSDKSLSDTFVTNMEIFKWLFNSTIYDSEYVDTNAFGNFLYRPYKNIANEGSDYYNWGEELSKHLDEKVGNSVSISGVGYQFNSIPKLYFESLNQSDDVLKTYLSSFARIEKNYYTDTSSYLVYDSQLLSDLEKVKGKTEDYKASTIGLWGSVDGSNISQKIFKTTDFSLQGYDYGIHSNLPSGTGGDIPDSLKESPEKLSRAIFLKNTESPYYYFYSVLKYRYQKGSSGNSFKKALLDKSTFKISAEESKDISWNDTRNVTNKFRDYLDMEGLFTYMIPYLHDANTYVINWQAVNGSEIVQYDFRYEVDADGNPINIGVIDGDKDHPETQKPENVGYEEAVRQKNQMNKIWNMYCPWVDSLYALRKSSETVSVGGKKIYIQDTLNPSSYLQNGRPMIFSEADMILRGYKYKDLTDIERRIQAVLENTYTDLMYLVNYYDMDEEVLLSAAAMYATFNFNREFSQNSLFGTSIMLYPQGFELRNFNYDAYMRLALLNSTGESVYDTSDLFTRVMSKTSIFTGLLLLVCDVVACIAIPMFKFVILVGLLFLGVLICLVCVVNPPEKIFEAVCKSLLLPTVLFMVLNIGFAWVMSFVVGEGLTSYVGSKTINFATNDPTITILIMALLGVAYIYFAWKILKFLISAYKQFGMSTALATVGIVGAAFAGLSKKVMHTAGGILGEGAGAVGAGASAAYGLATGEKGHRLEDAKDAMRHGVGGLNDRRRAEKRQADREKEVSDASTDRIVDAINQKASTPNDNGNTSNQEDTTNKPNLSKDSDKKKSSENAKKDDSDIYKNVNKKGTDSYTNGKGDDSYRNGNSWDNDIIKYPTKKDSESKKSKEGLKDTESKDRNSRGKIEGNGKKEGTSYSREYKNGSKDSKSTSSSEIPKRSVDPKGNSTNTSTKSNK